MFPYTLLGAATLLYALAPEVQLTAGVSPAQPAVVESHVALVTRLFLPAERGEPVRKAR